MVFSCSKLSISHAGSTLVSDMSHVEEKWNTFRSICAHLSHPKHFSFLIEQHVSQWPSSNNKQQGTYHLGGVSLMRHGATSVLWHSFWPSSFTFWSNSTASARCPFSFKAKIPSQTFLGRHSHPTNLQSGDPPPPHPAVFQRGYLTRYRRFCRCFSNNCSFFLEFTAKAQWHVVHDMSWELPAFLATPPTPTTASAAEASSAGAHAKMNFWSG